MIERRGGARFPLETMKAFGISRHASREHFDGNVASQPYVSRAIYLPHATSTNQGDDFVGAETNAGRKRHGLPRYERSADYRRKRWPEL
jgi:hypothetical protein